MPSLDRGLPRGLPRPGQLRVQLIPLDTEQKLLSFIDQMCERAGIPLAQNRLSIQFNWETLRDAVPDIPGRTTQDTPANREALWTYTNVACQALRSFFVQVDGEMRRLQLVAKSLIEDTGNSRQIREAALLLYRAFPGQLYRTVKAPGNPLNPDSLALAYDYRTCANSNYGDVFVEPPGIFLFNIVKNSSGQIVGHRFHARHMPWTVSAQRVGDPGIQDGADSWYTHPNFMSASICMGEGAPSYLVAERRVDFLSMAEMSLGVISDISERTERQPRLVAQGNPTASTHCGCRATKRLILCPSCLSFGVLTYLCVRSAIRCGATAQPCTTPRCRGLRCQNCATAGLCGTCSESHNGVLFPAGTAVRCTVCEAYYNSRTNHSCPTCLYTPYLMGHPVEFFRRILAPFNGNLYDEPT